MDENQLIYSKPVIEFATVAAESCLFLERAEEHTKTDFITTPESLAATLKARKESIQNK